MKVYELSNICRADGHSGFATLNNKRTDNKLLDHCGSGKPFPAWRNVELYFDNSREKKGDFMGFGLNFVCSERARDVVWSVLESSGELMLLKIKGQSKPYYLYNGTTIIDALDPDGSMWT